MKKQIAPLAIGLIALGSLLSVAEEPMPVGLQKQLFVDDYIIAEKENVTRELGEGQKCGIVLGRWGGFHRRHLGRLGRQ